MNEISVKLKLLQQVSGKTQGQLAQELGVTILSFSNWINGKSIPRDKKIAFINTILAKYDVPLITHSLEDGRIQDERGIKNLFLESLRLNNKGILEKILRRKDLVDEFSLQITYNTNSIEGSTMTVDDTYNVIFKTKTIVKKSLLEQLEAKNHHEAFLYLIDYISSARNQIDVMFAKRLHKILMNGILETAGEFRNHPVRIVGSYVPTSNYLKVEKLIEDLFVNGPKTIEEISKFHANLEQIHPFSDGNGRVGRLILISQLLRNDYAPAMFNAKLKHIYYKSLQDAQLKQNYSKLVEHVLDAIITGYKIIVD